jgi:hypothetical protein
MAEFNDKLAEVEQNGVSFFCIFIKVLPEINNTLTLLHENAQFLRILSLLFKGKLSAEAERGRSGVAKGVGDRGKEAGGNGCPAS